MMSIGTINLSKPLERPESNIDFQDSAARVIAIISAMRNKLGKDFPSSDNERIPDAWIVISGEP
jgi:hypothetical protein